MVLHHQGESEEPSGGKEKEGSGQSSKGRKKSLNLNPRFSYLSYRRDYFRAKQVWIQTPGHVSVDLLSFFATRTCQVHPIGYFVLQKLFLAVLTVGNAPVGNVPFSPHGGGGLRDKRLNIAMFTSQFNQLVLEHVKL